MQITSSAFDNNTSIPDKYTCSGKGISPPLDFADIPDGTKSLVLVVSDPDAVGKIPFYHWVVFNIDPSIKSINECTAPSGSKIGENDFGKTNYGTPCPPHGTGVHRYLFELLALDSRLDLNEGISAEKLLIEMSKHIIETSRLIGLYPKKYIDV